MVDQLPDIEQFFRVLSPDPKQGIEVPKILPFDVPMRAAVRVPQLAEQLVEVPTIISYSSLHRTVEQLRRHSSSWWWRTKFLVFKVFPLDRVQQRRLPPRNAFLSGLWSRSLTLFQVDVFMVLSQDKVHLLLTLQLVLKNWLMSLVKGFFVLISKIKKVRSWASHSSPRVPASVSPSTPAAQLEVAPMPDSLEWVQLRERQLWQDLLLEQTY